MLLRPQLAPTCACRSTNWHIVWGLHARASTSVCTNGSARASFG
jgi:hypothetical protein